MYKVYVLKSQRNGKQYIGSTAKDPLVRFKEHNSGSNRWSKNNRPFELVYSETFADRTQARKRELFLKSTTGRRQLKQILSAYQFKGG